MRAKTKKELEQQKQIAELIKIGAKATQRAIGLEDDLKQSGDQIRAKGREVNRLRKKVVRYVEQIGHLQWTVSDLIRAGYCISTGMLNPVNQDEANSLASTSGGELIAEKE